MLDIAGWLSCIFTCIGEFGNPLVFFLHITEIKITTYNKMGELLCMIYEHRFYKLFNYYTW